MCILCSRTCPSRGEELGQAFSLRAAREDLERLLGADGEEDDVFDDIPEDNDDGIAEAAKEDHEMIEIDGERPGQPGAERDEADLRSRGRERGLARVGPYVLRRQRQKGPPTAHQDVNMLKKAKTPRSREKQLEKEIPWTAIPDEIRPQFKAAEAKQWQEHLDNHAIEVLSLDESARLRSTVGAERILSSRYAYRDKNMGKRRADPTTPWKAKSRLVVAGHRDPDIGTFSHSVDSPTVSRATLILLFQIAASLDWQLAAGDVQAAFLNGLSLQRDLWMEQPKCGVEGLDPRQIAKIRKGIFGLSESPRMWYDRLCQVLLTEVFEVDDEKYTLKPCPLDPCVFLLTKDGDENTCPQAYIAIHVDDLLIIAPEEINCPLRVHISKLFPVDDWEENEFDYVGSHVKRTPEGIEVTQTSFVEGRLFQVEVSRHQQGHEPATEEQAIDNRSLIGAFSWLATQTRPDLQCPVALAQQLQRAPLVEDVRFSNNTVNKAILHKERGIFLHKIDIRKALVVVFHDAAWANAELEEAEDHFRLTASEVERGTIRELYDEHRQRKAKKSRSKVASQLGHMIMLFPDNLLGTNARGSLLEWRSQSCKRVCRSTFGAETMSAVEGLEGAQYTRASWGLCSKGGL